MFGKLKDKLKGWFKSSKETIEEGAEVVETEEALSEKGLEGEHESGKKTQKEEEISRELSKEEKQKIAEKADKLIEKTKHEKQVLIPTKYDELEKQTKPDLIEIQKEAETIKKEVKKAEKKEKKVKKAEEEYKEFQDKADKLVEKAKTENIPETPISYNIGTAKFEPDLEKIQKSAPEQESEGVDGQNETLEGTLPEEKKSFFQKVKSSFTYKISENEFNEIFDDLEFLLLENNVALEVVEDIRSKLSEKLIGKEIKKQDLEEQISTELKNTLNEILIEPDNPLEIIKISQKPFTILFFGINGTGKTTSIAKVTNFLKQAGFSVVLAAGDTFRAASIEQLEQHAERLKVSVIKQNYGADPAAVGFDAIKYAKNHKIDVVLIDTAGRMHTKSNLIEEMKKIERVTKPDLKIFVAESIAGNDAVEQAKTFNKAIEIDGAILSKADIDEKGGTIISVSHATGKPIFYLGVGQEYNDLELFNKQKFIESLGL